MFCSGEEWLAFGSTILYSAGICHVATHMLVTRPKEPANDGERENCPVKEERVRQESLGRAGRQEPGKKNNPSRVAYLNQNGSKFCTKVYLPACDIV